MGLADSQASGGKGDRPVAIEADVVRLAGPMRPSPVNRSDGKHIAGRGQRQGQLNVGRAFAATESAAAEMPWAARAHGNADRGFAIHKADGKFEDRHSQDRI